MTPIIYRSLWVVPWGAAVFGSLQIHKLDLGLAAHDICGPWGCGPPLESLIGYHSFWFLLVTALVFGVGAVLSRSNARRVGLALLAFGLVAALGYAGWDAATYAWKAGSAQYAVQRFFFTLATSVDLPTLQIAVAGLAMMLMKRGSDEEAAAIGDRQPLTEVTSQPARVADVH